MESKENKREKQRIDETVEIRYSFTPAYKQERRRFIRIPEDAAISFTAIPVYKGARTLTKDLSQGGIKFISNHFVSPKSILRVEINLKYAAKIISAIVRTVWTREIFDDERYDIGAEFIEINKADLEFLRHYLSKRR